MSLSMNDLTLEKVFQTIEILKEKNIDLWMTFVRETSHGGDPILPVIYGPHTLTWPSALIFTQQGDRIAIVGQLEVNTAQGLGLFSTVLGYDESIRSLLLQTLNRLNPAQIAINFSASDVLADGLTVGMYRRLLEMLTGTPFAERLISAETIIASLNGRKTPGELQRIRSAVELTEVIFQETYAALHIGMSEIQIAEWMHARLRAHGVEPGWGWAGCPAVNNGPDSIAGHSLPGELQIQPGNIVHFDFGVKKDGYCSDLQRVVYFLAPGETQPPAEVTRAFETAKRALRSAVAAMKPGILGLEIDTIAREIVTSAGYPEFKYALGHQVGRHAHDGGGLLGPHWDKYGTLPDRPLEIGQVYAVEPGIMVPGYGYLGLEENVVITESGAEYLTPPQDQLVIKPSA